MTGKNRKWKAQKQKTWFEPGQLLSDGGWWMCSVGIGVSHLKIGGAEATGLD